MSGADAELPVNGTGARIWRAIVGFLFVLQAMYAWNNNSPVIVLVVAAFFASVLLMTSITTFKAPEGTRASDGRVACPYCREKIDTRAARCPHCHKDLLSTDAVSNSLGKFTILGASVFIVMLAWLWFIP